MIVLVVLIIAYPFGVTLLLARAIYRTRGFMAGLATAIMTAAGWFTDPTVTFLATVPAMCIVLWFERHQQRARMALPELPRAQVV
jgi:uncharacterized membrane protein